MKKFDELRVVDLRAELEKRGMDKSGVKATLIDRLSKAILDEGDDPQETNFDLDSSLIKQSSNSELTEENIYEIEDEDVNASEADMEENETPIGLTEENINGTEDEDINASEADMEENMTPIELTEEIINETEDEELNEENINETEEEGLTEQNINGTEDEDMNASEADMEEKETTIDETRDSLDENEEGTSEKATKEEDTSEDLMGEINMQEDAIDLLLEDEDKILDYEENYRMDMDDNAEERDKEKAADKDEANALDTEGINGSDEIKGDSSQKDGEKSTCNLWVSGLRQSTKAQDLRTIFLKYGKVLSVKIVTNAKSTTGRCFGFITMATKESAENCISNLHQTEINGRIILVELAKGDLGGASKVTSKPDNKVATSVQVSEHSKRSQEKKRDSDKNDRDKDKSSRSRSQSRTRISAKDRVVDRRHKIKENYSSKSPRKDVLNLRKIENEHVKQRQRTRERLMREEERRKRDEYRHSKDLERRQKEEGMKLQREREKLRFEREQLEREKQDLVRIERDQQKLERDRIQREREEIRRQALKYEEVRRGLKRPAGSRDGEFYDQRKRSAPDNRSRFEDLPTPPISSHRFDRPNNRELESRSGGNHYDDRRNRGDDRRRSDERPHREQVAMHSSTQQQFRERPSKPRARPGQTRRFPATLMSQGGVTESWRPSGSSHGNKVNYGGTPNVQIPNLGVNVGRTANESQGGWRSSSNGGATRWNSTNSVPNRSGQTLLEMMHRGSEQHVSPGPINPQPNMTQLSGVQQNDRFSSINYRSY